MPLLPPRIVLEEGLHRFKQRLPVRIPLTPEHSLRERKLFNKAIVFDQLTQRNE